MVNPISEGWQPEAVETIERQTSSPLIANGESEEVADGSLNHRTGEVIKSTVSRSLRFRLVSLESVHKVVTIDMDLASKNYWPTWRCVVKG